MNEQILSIALTLIGTVWTVFGVQDRIAAWLEKRTGAKKAKALMALAAGAQKTYDVYVREIKKGRADGKLTKAEIDIARNMALREAKLFAELQGVDLVVELGGDYLTLWLERILKSMRKGSAEDVGLSGLIAIAGFGPKAAQK